MFPGNSDLGGWAEAAQLTIKMAFGKNVKR